MHEGVTKRARTVHEAATGAAARLSREGRPSAHVGQGGALAPPLPPPFLVLIGHAASLSQVGLGARRTDFAVGIDVPEACLHHGDLLPRRDQYLSLSLLSLPPHTNTPPIRGPQPFPSPRPPPPPKSLDPFQVSLPPPPSKSFPGLPPPLFCRPLDCTPPPRAARPGRPRRAPSLSAGQVRGSPRGLSRAVTAAHR